MPFWSRKNHANDPPAARAHAAVAASVGGQLGWFGLGGWWLTSMTPAERAYIKEVYNPLGGASDDLDTGTILATSMSATMLLSNVAGWFRRPEDRHLAERLLDKAFEFSDDPVLDRHFLWQQIHEIYALDRDDPDRQAKALSACARQIEMAPEAAAAFLKEYPGQPLPRHHGYSVINRELERRADFDGAITVIRQCEGQGWTGCGDRQVELIEQARAKHQRKLLREQKAAEKAAQAKKSLS